MANFVWGAGGARMTPEEIAAEKKVAQALMQQGMDYSPVQHWSQGASRVAQALMGGLDYRMAGEASKANAAADKTMLEGLLGGAGVAATPTMAPAAVPAPPSGGGYGDAIASVESGGRYDALGPVIPKTGDRAYGKFQVMGANVPAWTKAHLGQEMTPQQFVASPEAQEAVFKGQFGQYAQKYGPEGAAKAWFAGEQGMNNPNARDLLGTTVASYANKFNNAMGAQPAAAPATSTAGMNPSDVSAQAMPQAAPAAQGMSPNIIKAMTSPYASDGTKKIAAMLLQQQMQAGKVSTVDLGNAVGVMDQRGNIVRQIPKSEPNKGAAFVDGPPDPVTGLPTKVWADPRDKSVTPYTPPAAPAQASAIPPAPPGVDPKIWREAQSKRQAEQGMPASWDDTSKLRNEVQGLPSYKNLAQAAPVYKSMLDAANRDNRAADVNLIYGMAKIMDPGSVVRESEMTVAQAVATLPEQLKAAVFSQLEGKGRLSPDVRDAIMQEAHSRVNSYRSLFDEDTGMYRGIAERNRMNTADVLPSFGELPAYARPVAPAAAPAIDDLLKKYGGQR